jgi:hypothetical protein
VNAADHVRMQMNGLGNELWRTIAVLCFGALVVGILMGLLYQRWRDAPVVPSSTLSPALVVQPAAPPQPAPEHHASQNRKKRSQSNTPTQVQGH